MAFAAAMAAVGVGSELAVVLVRRRARSAGGRTRRNFALTHLFWLGTYPAVGFLGRAVGVPVTFTLAGGVALLATAGAVLARRPHRPHALTEAEP